MSEVHLLSFFPHTCFLISSSLTTSGRWPSRKPPSPFSHFLLPKTSVPHHLLHNNQLLSRPSLNLSFASSVTNKRKKETKNSDVTVEEVLSDDFDRKEKTDDVAVFSGVDVAILTDGDVDVLSEDDVAVLPNDDVALLGHDVPAFDNDVADAVAKLGADVAASVRILLKLECSKQQLKRLLKKNHVLLGRCYPHIARKASIFHSFGISSQDFFTAMEKSLSSGNFILASDEKLESIIFYLRESLGVQSLGKVLRNHPQILGNSLATLESKVELWESLGVPLTPQMVEAYPVVLSHSLDRIKEGVETVKSILREPIAYSILTRFPCLAFRKKTDLMETFVGLQSILGIEEAGRLLESDPFLLLVSRDTLLHTFEQFIEVFGGEISLKMVKTCPGLLHCTWNVTRPKLDFVFHEMGRSKEEVAVSSSILTCSLEKRIKPRYYALVQVGKKDLALATMFNCSPQKFEKLLGVSVIP